MSRRATPSVSGPATPRPTRNGAGHSPLATARFGVPLMSEVTCILSAIEQGDPSAAEQLLPLVYDELRKLAEEKMAHERPGHSLEATALVHEAYLRLVGDGRGPHWN